MPFVWLREECLPLPHNWGEGVRERSQHIMSDKIQNHIALPPEIHAFMCARCGAVGLSPDSVCGNTGPAKERGLVRYRES